MSTPFFDRVLARLALALPFALMGCGDEPAGSSGGRSSGMGGDGGTALGTPDAEVGDGGTSVPELPLRSAGCGQAAAASPAQGDAKKVDVAGQQRGFVQFVPKGYDPNRNYPLVVVFHGIGATGAQMAEFIKMQDYSGGNAIVAFPDALRGRWDTGGEVDLAFFDALTKNVQDALCVNQQRVFVLGFSFGAYMANHLGCRRSNTIRAIIPAAGGFGGAATACGRTATLVYHRRDDDNEPVRNGVAARDKWLGINGCGTNTAPVAEFGLQGLGCVAYASCPSKAQVLWCEDTAASPYKHDLRDVYRVPMWNWFAHF